MISRSIKTRLPGFGLSCLAMLLLVSEASAFSVIYGKGYSSKRTAYVEFIYPKGHVPDIASSEDVVEDGPGDLIEQNVTINRHVHVTVYQVERHYRPHIRVHRAASFHPSRIRLHRAGTFAY